MFDTPTHWHFGDQPRIKWKHLKGMFWPWLLVASDSGKYLSLAEASRTGAGGTSGALKSYTVRKNGSIRVKFDFKANNNDDYFVFGVNGVGLTTYFLGTSEYPLANTWYSSAPEDIIVKANDVITIVGHSFNTGNTEYVRNFIISYDVEKFKYNHKVNLD